MRKPTASSLLEELERANLFLIPLDDERRWYRYHHLFAEVLRERLAAVRPTAAVADAAQPRQRLVRAARSRWGGGAACAAGARLGCGDAPDRTAMAWALRSVASS